MARLGRWYKTPLEHIPQTVLLSIAVRTYREQGCTDEQVLAFVQETFPEVTALPPITNPEGGSPMNVCNQNLSAAERG